MPPGAHEPRVDVTHQGIERDGASGGVGPRPLLRAETRPSLPLELLPQVVYRLVDDRGARGLDDDIAGTENPCRPAVRSASHAQRVQIRVAAEQGVAIEKSTWA